MSHSLKQILRKLQRHPREQTVFHNRLQNNSTPHLDPNHRGADSCQRVLGPPGSRSRLLNPCHPTDCDWVGWLLAGCWLLTSSLLPQKYQLIMLNNSVRHAFAVAPHFHRESSSFFCSHQLLATDDDQRPVPIRRGFNRIPVTVKLFTKSFVIVNCQTPHSAGRCHWNWLPPPECCRCRDHVPVIWEGW